VSAGETLKRCERKIIALYRARAHTALAHARQARHDGDAAALRGYVSKARLWHRFSLDWAQRAREPA